MNRCHSAQYQEDNGLSKQYYREEVWGQLVKNRATIFPSPYGRIPNFKGACNAASKLFELEAFKLAKSIEVNPDKPLEPSRLLVLESGKQLYVPTPRLKHGLLKKLTTQEGLSKHKIASRWGIENTGSEINMTDNVHIDFFILGSVAVSKEGYRIGKGEGFADLEYAILKEMKAVDDNAVIVTTVHDLQVFDTLPKELFKKHDVPVDYILTPTQIITVENKLPRPEGIYWDLLSQEHLSSIPVLKNLKKHKENDMLPAESNNRSKPHNGNKYSKKASYLNSEEVISNRVTVPEISENVPPRKHLRESHMFNVDFSLLVRNIERHVRVSDLKKALLENGIKPFNITWKGNSGYCYLHFATNYNTNNENRNGPFAIDNVIEIIQGLKITPNCTSKLDVQVMEPITRIEITDVTSV
ncbi:hypothetical protein NQ317_013876 [Molorchus minor]|uniref:Methenyltetrahydrofolate synthase domain-containing protein n=1 Tax=Molorchus minor TaxID=1323400 RepID=A0ABQ9K7G9_9CUCU|nr:hypothetical protein NQ317_013876 [Molorchus minor]